jgi:hypothetical protein
LRDRLLDDPIDDGRDGRFIMHLLQ